MGKLESLCGWLQQQSEKVFHIFREPVEDIMEDPLLAELRNSCEYKTFHRFLQNYTRCLANCRSLEAEEDLSVNVVRYRVRDRDQEWLVVNWHCGCGEYEKTGVQCPHVIRCAKHEGKRYTSLLMGRWKRSEEDLRNIKVVGKNREDRGRPTDPSQPRLSPNL